MYVHTYNKNLRKREARPQSSASAVICFVMPVHMQLQVPSGVRVKPRFIAIHFEGLEPKHGAEFCCYRGHAHQKPNVGTSARIARANGATREPYSL
jgi:hypothetical protein